MPTQSGDDAIALPLMLDLHHDALVGLVCSFAQFCNNTVQPGAFEAAKPVLCDAAVRRCGCDVDWRLRRREYRFQVPPPLAERCTHQKAIAFTQDVEEDN